MEHRWGHRVATDIDVQLFGCPASIGWGRLRDVSLSGGFIETKLALQPLATLRMALPAKSHAPAEARTVQGVVIRRAASGIGVEWMDSAAEIIQSLIHAATERQVVDPSRRLVVAAAQSPRL